MVESNTEKMVVEEINKVEQDLKSLSIKTKEKKVQFSPSIYTQATQIKNHAKGKALTVDTISMSDKLKRPRHRKKSRVQIGKFYSTKKKLNFDEDDGEDDGKEKKFDQTSNDITLDESVTKDLPNRTI